MARQIQLRRGNKVQNDAFTGVEGELTMVTDTKGIRLHDGSKQGGYEIPVLVDIQRPTADNNYTWYRLYSDGWVEQGGTVVVHSGTVAHDTYSTKSITFPIAMQTTKCWHCQAKHDRFNAGFTNTDGVTTGATVYQVNDSSAAFNNPFVIWEVKGYIAT